jgi:SWIM zinc finger
MTQFTYSSLVLTTLKQVSSDRLQRAVCGFADGSLTVTLTRQSDAEIRALVKNGDGKEYGVILTEALTACSCRDALYRGGICKHGVAVALHVLRTPQPQKAVLAPQFPTFHLMWRDGIVLCGDPHADRVQMWPWTAGMVTWPEVCPWCVATYKRPKMAMAKAA